ncbi:MAG: hypothetical protein JRF56_02240, partial [Deltaproteobacteria bacterium]|nr:hypothetical protein [Deltaproteobacteria bacterium]
MKRRYWRQIFLGISLVLAIYLCMPTFLVLAQDSMAGQSSSPAKNMTPEAVDSHIAAMTDEQVRQAYAQKLKQESAAQIGSKPAAEGKGTWQDISAQFYGAARAAAAVLKRAGTFFSEEQKDSGRWRDAIAKLTDGKGGSHLVLTLTGLIVIIALGLAVRWLFLRTTSDIRQKIINAVRLGKLQFLGRVLS